MFRWQYFPLLFSFTTSYIDAITPQVWFFFVVRDVYHHFREADARRREAAAAIAKARQAYQAALTAYHTATCQAVEAAQKEHQKKPLPTPPPEEDVQAQVPVPPSRMESLSVGKGSLKDQPASD